MQNRFGITFKIFRFRANGARRKHNSHVGHYVMLFCRRSFRSAVTIRHRIETRKSPQSVMLPYAPYSRRSNYYSTRYANTPFWNTRGPLPVAARWCSKRLLCSWCAIITNSKIIILKSQYLVNTLNINILCKFWSL